MYGISEGQKENANEALDRTNGTERICMMKLSGKKCLNCNTNLIRFLV